MGKRATSGRHTPASSRRYTAEIKHDAVALLRSSGRPIAAVDPDGWLTATPVLVVEVTSPSTATTDWTLKHAVYGDAGVRAFWLVDPVEPSLTVFQLEDAAYREAATVRAEEPYEATFPFAVTVMPAALAG